MSQGTVAFIVGRLLTDRNFRIQFAVEPLDTLAGVQREGRDLTAAEAVALVQANMQMWFWPDEKGLTTLRNVLVAFEKSRQSRLLWLSGVAGTTANAPLEGNQSSAGLADFQTVLDSERTALPIQDSLATTGGDRVTPLVPALSAVEGPALSAAEGPALSVDGGPGYRVLHGSESPTADESTPAGRHRGFRWLLLALLCFVLAFILGFATGYAQAP